MTESLREKYTSGFWKNLGTGFLTLFPSHKEEEHTIPIFFSAKNIEICVQYFCPGEPIRESDLRLLLGADHIGIFCLARTQVLDSKKESTCLL